MLRNPRFHSGGYSYALMNSRKVVVHVMQRQGYPSQGVLFWYVIIDIQFYTHTRRGSLMDKQLVQAILNFFTPVSQLDGPTMQTEDEDTILRNAITPLANPFLNDQKTQGISVTPNTAAPNTEGKSTGFSSTGLTQLQDPKAVLNRLADKDSQLPITSLVGGNITDDLIQKYQKHYEVSNSTVTEPILKAAKATGVDPDILFRLARAESNYDPKAKSKTSSATGLFQFTKGTWDSLTKDLKKTHGAAFSNDKTNPYDNALAGGTYVNEIKKQLAPARKSGDVTVKDIYLGHFSGPSTAKRVIASLESGKGNQPASIVYSPKVMQANKNIFYNDKGKVRSLQTVYDLLTEKVT